MDPAYEQQCMMKTSFIRLLFITSLAFFVTACAPSYLLNPARIPASEIRGRVVDGKTGKPLADATVTATIPSGGYWTKRTNYDLGSATSDATGAFVLNVSERTLMNVERDDSPISVRASSKDYFVNRAIVQVSDLAKGPVIVEIKVLPVTEPAFYVCESQNGHMSCTKTVRTKR